VCIARSLASIASLLAALAGSVQGGGTVDGGGDGMTVGSTSPAAASWVSLPVNAPFDYQIGGDYEPPVGVEVVARDWFAGTPLANGCSICYVNAFQTQPDEDGIDRPDERSNWPDELVLGGLGDPSWRGEYLIDLSTAASRRAAAEWVEQMIQVCDDKGFDAVEFDNLDSWTRFQETPIADQVPFGPAESVAYAARLTQTAHDRGLAAAQKNALELDAAAVAAIGFDFLIVENCARFDECDTAADHFDARVLDIEYDRDSFAAACHSIGDRSSVVLRDIAVSQPTSATYVYDEC
jgi:hypothetical protein